jgi:prephenate dehydratase
MASGQLQVHVGLNRVTQVMIHTQVVSQGTGVVNVHNEDIAAYCSSTSTSVQFSSRQLPCLLIVYARPFYLHQA